MRKGKITQGKSVLCYTVFGSGSKKMLAFHGYGQDHRAFLSWRSTLDGYTIYAFDLFLFGQSEWHEDTHTIRHTWWDAIIRNFLQAEKIDAFALMGFSLGARIALLIYQQFSSKVLRLILIAPDGISANPWYRFATGSMMTRSMFRYMLQRPGTILQPLRLFRGVGMFGAWEHRFVVGQLQTPRSRERVFAVWNLYRKMVPSVKCIGEQLRNCPVPVLVFVGRSDKIIGKSSVVPLLKAVPQARYVELNAGHGSMILRSAQWLAGREC